MAAHRGWSAPRWTVPVAVLAVALVVATGTTQVRAAQADAAEADLIESLVAVEEVVEGVAYLPDVTVFEDRTWGTISGNFVGDSVLLDEVDPELNALVASASEIGSPTADAVENVAAAYRTMAQAYRHLAAYERAGLAPPGPDEDEEDEAVEAGVDEARGNAEVGLSLLLEALPGFQNGYAVLRDTAEGGPLFERRFAAVQGAARSQAADARSALSYPATHLLLAVERHTSRFGTAEPERVVRYACVDRDDYLELRAGAAVGDLPVPEGEQPDLPIPDCPAPDNESDVRVIDAGA